MNLSVTHTDYSGSTLINKGNFTPATSNNARLQEFKALNKGMLICIGLPNYVGDHGTREAVANATTPAGITSGLNFNTDAWATAHVNSGCKYSVLTVTDEYGWLMWDSDVQWPAPTQVIPNTNAPSGFTSPTFRKYGVNVNGSVNRNLVSQWASSMRANGVEPIPYLNVAGNFNGLGGNISRVSASSVLVFVKYVAMLLQELIVRHKFRYVWIDNYQGLIDGNMQILYNAVKSISTDCLLIVSQNSTSGGFAKGFPCDIVTIEEYSLTVPATQLATSRTFNGVTYYTPVEVVAPTLTNEQYFKMFPNVFPSNYPANWTFSPRTQADLQAKYTSWRGTYGANYLLGVSPDENGTLLFVQTDLIKNLA